LEGDPGKTGVYVGNGHFLHAQAVNRDRQQGNKVIKHPQSNTEIDIDKSMTNEIIIKHLYDFINNIKKLEFFDDDKNYLDLEL